MNQRFVIFSTFLICLLLVAITNVIYGIDIVYTHLFYIPIILTGVWYPRYAIVLAASLGLIHITSNYKIIAVFNFGPLLRAVMFIVVAYVTSYIALRRDRLLNELRKSDEALKQSNNELERRIAEQTEELRQVNEGLQKDLTRRKQTEEFLRESEERFREIVNSSQAGYFFIDCDGAFQNVNNAWLKMHKYSSLDEVIGKQFYLTQLNVDLAEAKKTVERLLCGDTIPASEFSRLCKDGSIGYHLFSSHPVIRNGQTVGLEGFIIDITERKLAGDKIKSLLAEKELLLSEVHHRIKNNMNVIISLLSLQSNLLKDSLAVSSLEDAIGRVQSMMVLYDKLYQSGDFRAISAKEYLTSLADEIVNNFPNRGLVKIEKQIDDRILDAKTLSPVGMIFNELITNAMKHAFTGREDGLIRASLSFKDNHATLIIQDNGLGIPESVDIATSAGFGMRLVEILTKQLQGTIRLERQNGSKFILELEV